MQIITGIYISVMIPLFVWFVINAILTYRSFYNLYEDGYGIGGRSIWEILFRNYKGSSGGFNEPTGCIFFVTAAYAFLWLTYFVFRFIIY